MPKGLEQQLASVGFVGCFSVWLVELMEKEGEIGVHRQSVWVHLMPVMRHLSAGVYPVNTECAPTVCYPRLVVAVKVRGTSVGDSREEVRGREWLCSGHKEKHAARGGSLVGLV